jgi:hypothetical protein
MLNKKNIFLQTKKKYKAFASSCLATEECKTWPWAWLDFRTALWIAFTDIRTRRNGSGLVKTRQSLNDFLRHETEARDFMNPPTPCPVGFSPKI